MLFRSHRCGNGGELVGGHAGTAAKHHVFHRVRGAGKFGGTFIRADAIIYHRRDNRRERVGDDDDLQPIGQCSAQHILIFGGRAAGNTAEQRSGKKGGG